jgi:hypothetical protein
MAMAREVELFGSESRAYRQPGQRDRGCCGEARRRASELGCGDELPSGHANIGYGVAHTVMHGGNTNFHLVLNPDVELAEAHCPGTAFLRGERRCRRHRAGHVPARRHT